MAVAERGSFLWMMFAITQILLSIKLMGEVEGWVTTLFGGSGGSNDACNGCLPPRTTGTSS